MTSDSSGGGPRSLPLILSRELAANLSTPMVLIDGAGWFVYCNEAAELMLGRPFGDMGQLTASELGGVLDFRGLDGEALRRRDTPPGRAFLQREPAHQRLLVTAFDGAQREVEVTSYPLFGRDQDMHGVLTVFWEAGS